MESYASIPGEVLSNQCILVAEFVYQKPDDPNSQVEERRSIVLALTGNKHSPYVTWDRWVSRTPLATGGTTCVETCSWGHRFATFEEAATGFLNRASEKDRYKKNKAAIRERGEQDGKAAASWFFDGNTPSVVYPRILKGIEDGDPKVMDMLPGPRVGGEFADDPTWEDIVKDETDIEEMSDDGELELYDAYVDAFATAVQDEIVRVCKIQIED